MPRGALLPSGSSPHQSPQGAHVRLAEADTAGLFAIVRNLRLAGWEREVALKRIEEQYGLLERQLAAAEGGWQRAQELQEQLETAQTRLREAHDQLCGCDHPTNPSRCSAPEETWGAFEGLGVRARVSTPASRLSDG